MKNKNTLKNAAAIFAAIAIFGVLLAATFPTASALEQVSHESGTENLNAGDYVAWPVTVDSSNYTLSIVVKVVSGPSIDVFIFTENQFQNYKNGNSVAYQDSSKLNVNSASLKWVPPNAGTYYVVIDNSAAGSAQPSGSSVSVNYNITLYKGVESSSSDSGGNTSVCLIPLVILLGIPMIALVVKGNVF